ncbi:hypothetical protein [Nitrospirillum pindoramense]|uniref:hypothetical protein n=1 Tax=Nitrospirillum amazonense TaxID=28077 RepID=UPI0011A1F504|nr:hypothetical protein [Nitrospirillum amazonense]
MKGHVLRKRILLLCIVMLIASSAGVIVWFETHKFQSCSIAEENIGPPHNGMQIALVNKLCDGIASSDDVSIKINMRNGNSDIIMEYGAAYSFVKESGEADPNISWNNDGSLNISIGVVSYINKKLSHINGIVVHYDIGRILFNK